MTARADIQSLEGATLALSATLPATYDAAGYGASTVVFTAIGKPESFGNHGVTANINTFTPVDTGVVTKTKGSKDYGNMAVMLGDVPVDAGQVIIDTASEAKAHYSLKITYPLGDGESTPEIHYLDVLVSKNENQDGAVNDIRKRSVEFAVCRKPIKVAAT